MWPGVCQESWGPVHTGTLFPVAVWAFRGLLGDVGRAGGATAAVETGVEVCLEEPFGRLDTGAGRGG